MDVWGFVTADGVAVSSPSATPSSVTAEDTTISAGDVVALAIRKEGVLAYVHEIQGDSARVIPLKLLSDNLQWTRAGAVRSVKFHHVTKVPARVDQMKIRL